MSDVDILSHLMTACMQSSMPVAVGEVRPEV